MNNTATPICSIVLVEDNESLREELALYLIDEGYAVCGVDCGRDLNDILTTSAVDIIILDLNLPEEEGISITRRLKAAMPGIGIIILSARVRTVDRLEGYTAGADVYLTKPTRPEELIAVVRNLLTRLRPSQVHPWQLDTTAMTLSTPDDKSIRLTPTEVIFLRELAISGSHVEYDVLISKIGSEEKSERINKARIEVLVSRLRTKLNTFFPTDSHCIKAMRGVGYQLGFALVIRNCQIVKMKSGAQYLQGQ